MPRQTYASHGPRRFRFDDFGIPEGSVVHFRESGIHATVAGPHTIILEGVERSVTGATIILRRRLMHRAIAPGARAHEWWTYDEKTLQQIWDDRHDMLTLQIPTQRRNPSWSRDELILALDLYVRHAGNPPGKASPEVLGR